MAITLHQVVIGLLMALAVLVGFVGPELWALHVRVRAAHHAAGMVLSEPPISPDTAAIVSLAHVPQALLIGVQKSGTSALYFNLCLHPGVACAALVKEPFFLSQPATERFVRSYRNVIDPDAQRAFHREYLATCFNLSKLLSHQMTLEASTTYFGSATAFQAISTYMPFSKTVKLIVILRDPISRAFSHYQHDKRAHDAKVARDNKSASRVDEQEFGSFASAIEDEANIMRHCREADLSKHKFGLLVPEAYSYQAFYECIEQSQYAFSVTHKRRVPGYLLKGLYFGLVHKWLSAFRERLLVLLYDDLRADPLRVMNQVQAFLELKNFDYNSVRDDLFHEFQKGSQYIEFASPLVAELAQEFRPHNELLALLLERPIAWDASHAR